MNIILARSWHFLFGNFMWLYMIMGICTCFLGIYPMTFQLLMGVSTLFLFSILHKFKASNILDFFVILFLVWIFINSLLIDYPNHWRMWYQSLMMNILPMGFYFIAKCVNYDINDVLKKATIPMIIALVGGLVFYYTEPGWYVAIKFRQAYELSHNNELRDDLLLELFRLSSFWVTPYVVGYAAMYFAEYTLVRLFADNIEKKIRRRIFLLFLLSAAVILLTQFRSTIYALVLAIVYLIFFAKNRLKFSYIIILVLSGFLLVGYLFDGDSDVGMQFKERMVMGVDSEELGSRLEFTAGDVDLYTACGNGFGRYGNMARSINNERPLRDCEYQKVLAELGVIGFIPFIGIIISGLFMSFRKRWLQLEFIIILFFSIAFVGASCISGETTFPFIYWYVLGRISVKSRGCYKIENYLQTKLC